MRSYFSIIALALLLGVAGVRAAERGGIGCPGGTTPRGEETPELREAWCEIELNGQSVQHGPYRAWWPNEKLGTTGQYDHGKAVGKWTGWYSSGQLQGEEWFEDGKKVKARYLDKKGREVEHPET